MTDTETEIRAIGRKWEVDAIGRFNSEWYVIIDGDRWLATPEQARMLDAISAGDDAIEPIASGRSLKPRW